MIDGVTILNTFSEFKTTGNAWYFDNTSVGSWFGVVCIIFCIIFITLTITKSVKDDEYVYLLWLILLVPALGFSIGGTFCHSIKEEQIFYKVTINESVSMKEFYEKYNVISNEGLIFTISYKENE